VGKYNHIISAHSAKTSLPNRSIRGCDTALLVSTAEVLELIAFEARAIRGRRGPCPLHGSEPNSGVFSTNLAKNTFQCFKCGAVGDHLDLRAGVNKKSLYRAALELCQRLGREIPWREGQRRGSGKG